MNKKALGLTILLHSLPLVSLISCQTPLENPQFKTENKDFPEEVVFVELIDEGYIACERSYLGIGTTTNFMGVVQTVAPNGPAAKAGILEGDLISNIDTFYPNMLPKGAKFVLNVERNEKLFDVTVVIDRVCYNG